MTDLSGTPAEQWLSVELRNAVFGDQIWDSFYQKWAPLEERRLAELKDVVFPNSIRPCRRRIDPTLDPAEPLRRELREAYGIIKGLIDIYERRTGGYLPRTYEAPALAWLDRNAAFGAGKGGE